MEKLKPCPFCGGESEIVGTDVVADNYYTSPEDTGYLVGCKKCLIGFEGYFESKEDAVTAWNTRPDNWTKFTIGKNEEGIDVYDCLLPEDEQEVLITDGKSVWQDTAMSDCDGFYFDGGDEIIKEITHWQPLPLPPKGEDK